MRAPGFLPMSTGEAGCRERGSIKELRERGYRITRQRQVLIDIILENEYSCCKEIYYKAVQKDENIGSATVYRMLKTLEEIGPSPATTCIK